MPQKTKLSWCVHPTPSGTARSVNAPVRIIFFFVRALYTGHRTVPRSARSVNEPLMWAGTLVRHEGT